MSFDKSMTHIIHALQWFETWRGGSNPPESPPPWIQPCILSGMQVAILATIPLYMYRQYYLTASLKWNSNTTETTISVANGKTLSYIHSSMHAAGRN